jgi:hypothetical protein
VPKYLSVCDTGLIYMRDNLINRYRVSFKVLEFLVLGIPVIGHLVGETHDRFSQFCFQCNDEMDFFNNIKYLLSLPGYHFGIEIQQSIRNDYSLENSKISLGKFLSS